MDEKTKQDLNNSEKNKAEFGNQTSSETATIMPTMIDDSEEVLEKKKDLSSIIPKSSTNEESTTAFELVSKDNTLKSDGAISLGVFNAEGEATINADAVLPEQIDMEQRKIERQKNKGKRKKKEKIKPDKKAMRRQNRVALIVLSIILLLAGFTLWYIYRPTEEDFKPKVVEVELGESLPIRTSSYVEPGISGTEIDELLYSLDLSQVNVGQVGEYDFTVTYKNIKKYGKLYIKDTTQPELEVRPVTIVEGAEYDASSFVEICHDLSGCNYSFQDNDTVTKYTTAGNYTVYVVATDAYQNSVTKKANLFIESQGSVKLYNKNVTYDNNVGYELTESYRLRFMEYSTYSLLITATHTRQFIYQDSERYQKAKEIYVGEENYEFDDSKMTITFTEIVNHIGSNYTRLTDIDSYLVREGFIASN